MRALTLQRFHRRLPPCRVEAGFYNPPMLDMKLIRDKSELVRERLAARGGGDESKVSEMLSLDEQRRKLLAEVEQLKSQRNRVSKEIGFHRPH